MLMKIIVRQNWLITINSAQEQMVSDKVVKENLLNSNIQVSLLKIK
jgi:hypothetical protein